MNPVEIDTNCLLQIISKRVLIGQYGMPSLLADMSFVFPMKSWMNTKRYLANLRLPK